MTGIDAFERYQRQDAWTWEHQALLRARRWRATPIFAPPSRRRGAACSCTRRAPRYLAQRRAGDAAAHAARTIARPARDNSTSSRTRAASPTSSFWCSTGCWRRRRRIRQLLTYTDNIRQLEGLAAAGVIDGGDGAMAEGGLYRLSHGAASPVARGRQGEAGGGAALRAYTARRVHGVHRDRLARRYILKRDDNAGDGPRRFQTSADRAECAASLHRERGGFAAVLPMPGMYAVEFASQGYIWRSKPPDGPSALTAAPNTRSIAMRRACGHRVGNRPEGCTTPQALVFGVGFLLDDASSRA